MKHNFRVTAILLGMFLLSQLIGLFIIQAYSPEQEQVLNVTSGNVENVTIIKEIPYGMQPPEDIQPETSLLSIFISIMIATALIFFLRKVNALFFLRIWFFSVIALSIAITLYGFFIKFLYGAIPDNLPLLALAISLPLTFYKVFDNNVFVHNGTELLIYPGIAVIFVPILTIWTGILLLIGIAAYDVYAVWHAQFMQKLAKFQIEKLKVFTGFFIPYVASKDRVKLQKIKALRMQKGEKEAQKMLKREKIKVNLAVLGGGDITLPLIFAGIIFRSTGVGHALIITGIATTALLLLFVLAKKGKFYPAMLFLSPACILGYVLGLLF